MRLFSFGLATATLPAIALSLMLVGCGDKKSGGGGGDEKGGKSKKDEKKQGPKVLSPGKGVLKGRIVMKGSPNTEALTKLLRDRIKMKDTEYCMKGPENETTEQEYRIGKDHTLGNVFVWVVPDSDAFFKVEDKQLKELDREVTIRQPHCCFIPHCAFLFSQYKIDPKIPDKLQPTGQVLKIFNDAQISHDTSWSGGTKNPGSDVILGKNMDRTVNNLVPDTKEITLKCNVHPWMEAYVRVIDTPYYDISKSDTLDGKDEVEKSDPRFGTYVIKNLPIGKVRVLAWHEKSGYLNKETSKGEPIEIQKDKESTKDFEAKPQ